MSRIHLECPDSADASLRQEADDEEDEEEDKGNGEEGDDDDGEDDGYSERACPHSFSAMKDEA